MRRFVFLAAAMALAASPALAHVKLVRSTPAAKAAGPSPSTVELQFSGKVEPKFSGFDVVRADGTKAALTPQPPSKDGKGLSAKLAQPLAPGAYKVAWRIVSADGHRMTGAYDFSVR
jgi:methionine-rich copper-binding protein CopC